MRGSIANAIIYYNSAILTVADQVRGKPECESPGHDPEDLTGGLARHIHMNGHYTFRGNGQPIDLDTIVAGLDLV